MGSCEAGLILKIGVPASPRKARRAIPRGATSFASVAIFWYDNSMDATIRDNITPGLKVDIIQKHHHGAGQLTRGIIAELLTNSANHPRGIKVRLTTGEVGRVHTIIG
jgi:uncharacterized repeat protein (TIGR03833 family)